MIPLRSITSRTTTAPASLVRRSTRASITTPALKLGWKVDGVSPMGGSALADITTQMPDSPFAKGVLAAFNSAERGCEPGFGMLFRPKLIKWKLRLRVLVRISVPRRPFQTGTEQPLAAIATSAAAATLLQDQAAQRTRDVAHS